MDIETLVGLLDDPSRGAPWFQSLNLEDPRRAHSNFVGLAKAGITLDLLALIGTQLERHLPGVSDPDMALNNLERYVAATRSPLSLGALLERDREALPILLQIFATSQHLSDQLVLDPEAYDLLRLTEGAPVARDMLVSEVVSEVSALTDERLAMAMLRRYKRRETLRIAYGDIIRNQSIDTVTHQISYLADALCEAALLAARRKVEEQRGVPRRPDGAPARLVVLALGKLGGSELNYSSDIDLMFLYDVDGRTDGPRVVSNQEFFERTCRQFIKLLAEPSEQGTCYRVDMRLRPSGGASALCVSLEAARRYYDVYGRTWERQAFVKARPIAGDLELGRGFLEDLAPWIYRRYLSRADITGIKALKRRIEQRADREGGGTRNVKTGSGGIRDIEFVIQFLQLLNGADLPTVRTGNTLEGIALLEQAGCLTLEERNLLAENYTFLRKIEHRLQIMFNLQTHDLPESETELRRLALRMGYQDGDGRAPLEAFRDDFQLRTRLNRRVLDFLLHHAFGEEETIEPEVDLVLDPDPPEDVIEGVLAKHGFRQPREAYANLLTLSTERISFLSTRRCRHFLAAIAPRLLAAIGETPDPDATLVDLAKVSDSIGGKGVLWELFSFNPATLNLYVRLCASSPYLSGILTSNPGMIDELMDSLVLDKLPSGEMLRRMLDDLCRGAEDTDPILHSFKNSLHLRVGVRDILGKDDIRDTHRVLSDVAEVLLQQIARIEYEKLLPKYGQPILGEGPRAGEPCELTILAMGKLGGREPNYHSDLDVIFLYDAEGSTRPSPRHRKAQVTSNQHFFSELGQRIIKSMTQLGPYGQLYEVDARLRPTGRSGALACPLAVFERYFESGQGQLWERQALCKARPVFGPPELRDRTLQLVRRAIVEPAWRPENAEAIRHMRLRMEEGASSTNLKRGAGGTVDLEFGVQMLQLRHAAVSPQVLVPGTFDALDALHAAGCLSRDDYEAMTRGYRLLRSIEARLRLLNTTARHDIPQEEQELKRLAYLLRHPDPPALYTECIETMAANRRLFNRIFDQAIA